MKTASVLLAASCLLSADWAQSLGTKAGIDVRNRVLFGNPAGSQTFYTGAELPWAAQPRRPRALVYALEAGGALGGVAVCGGVFALSSLEFSEALLITSLVGLPFASFCGTYLVGDALGEDGTALGTLLGACVAMPVGIGISTLAMAAHYSSHSEYEFSIVALAVLTIPTGAVVGYNLGIPKPSAGTVGRRLRLPGVTLTSIELPDHSREYGVGVQLASLRF